MWLMVSGDSGQDTERDSHQVATHQREELLKEKLGIPKSNCQLSFKHVQVQNTLPSHCLAGKDPKYCLGLTLHSAEEACEDGETEKQQQSHTCCETML